MMVPKDSFGLAFDNEICRTGMIYPAMVSNTLWALCSDETTKNRELYNLYFPKNEIFENSIFCTEYP